MFSGCFRAVFKGVEVRRPRDGSASGGKDAAGVVQGSPLGREIDFSTSGSV